MKKLISIALALMLLLSILTACDEGNRQTNVQSTPSGDQSVSIPAEYDDLLSAYVDTVHRLGSGEDHKIDTNYPDMTDDLKNAIRNTVSNAPYYLLGYGFKDINGDGKQELFFMKTDDISTPPCYEIYAVFTVGNNGRPRLLFSINANTESLAVDESGIIYYTRAMKGESSFVSMYRLLPSGEIHCTSYGHHDMTGWDDPDVYNYISICTYNDTYTEMQLLKDDGYTLLVNTRITDSEYEKLRNDLLKRYGSDMPDKPFSLCQITSGAQILVIKLYNDTLSMK